MLFDSIKFRLHGVKTGRVPSCFHFRFFIKTSTRISVGEISQNHQFQIRQDLSTKHVAHHPRFSMLKNRTEGIQGRMVVLSVRLNHLWLPTVPSSSSSAMVCATHPSQNPSNSLSS